MAFASEVAGVTTSDGRRLAVLDSGPAEGFPILIHMGTPNGLAALPSFLAQAVEGVRPVLYARPGYDESTPHPGRSVADAVSDSVRVLDMLGIEEFAALGWSGGGPHALACSALLPGRCLATAVIAGVVPYTEAVDLRDWYEGDEDNQLALRGDIDGFKERCDRFATQHAHDRAEDMPAWFGCEADKAVMHGEYAAWMASYVRSAFTHGGAGVCDDFIAFMSDWGFDLSDATNVALWHGTEDQNVPLAHGHWLAGRLPASELHVVQGEGHMSVTLRMADIVKDLLARTGGPGRPGRRHRLAS